MLADYPLKPLVEFLKAHKVERLASTDPRLHPTLTKLAGAFYVMPVDWAPGGAVVLHFGSTFPDSLPRVYLLNKEERPPVVPHVNFAGEICCYHPSTVVNATKPADIVQAVLAKAQVVWTKAYTADERLAEIEKELSAYWEQADMPTLFLRDGTVDHHALAGIAPFAHRSTSPLWQVVPVAAKEAKLEIALVIEVPREQLLDLLAKPLPTLQALASTATTLAVLKNHLARGSLHKRTLQLWLLLRCATSQGPILLASRGSQLLETDSRRSNFDERMEAWWKAKQSFQHFRIQDLRQARLQVRTAGPEQASTLGDVRLTLVGCGSLGGFLADSLTRAGIRAWQLVDSDILRPENLARHLLNFESLYQSKATELARVLRDRFQDIEVSDEWLSAQTEAGRKRLAHFGPTVVVSATGDTNTDLTLSEACRRGELGDCCFLWVEPNLAAGHIVYQPGGCPTGLHDLHEVVGGDAYYYKNRITTQPRDLLLTEAGCQVAFTPYGGADVQLFAVSAAREIAGFLTARPTTLVARRFVSGTWTTMP